MWRAGGRGEFAGSCGGAWVLWLRWRGRGGDRVPGSRRCSRRRAGEHVLCLAGLESTRARAAGTEGSAGDGARPRGRREPASEDSSLGHAWRCRRTEAATGRSEALGHVMKLRSARRPCCTFEPLRSTMAARTMPRTQLARRSAEARRDTDLQPRVRRDPRRSRHSCDAVASAGRTSSRWGCRLPPAGIAV